LPALFYHLYLADSYFVFRFLRYYYYYFIIILFFLLLQLTA